MGHLLISTGGLSPFDAPALPVGIVGAVGSVRIPGPKLIVERVGRIRIPVVAVGIAYRATEERGAFRYDNSSPYRTPGQDIAVSHEILIESPILASPIMSISFIPFQPSCSEDIKSYKYVVECYGDALLSFDPVTFDCGNVRMFKPLGLNLLASLIHNLHLRGREIIFIPPKDSKTHQYMVDQGFFVEFQFVSSNRQLKQKRRSTSVMLRRMHEFIGSYPIQIADWLSHNSATPKEAVEDMVAVTLPELMNNVFDHSYSPIGCCVCAQAYRSEGKLTMSVTDLGIGFLASLRPSFRHLKTDEEAIALAVQEGVSSKSNLRNRGAGLYILSDWLKEQRGELEIISMDGRWRQLPEGSIQHENLPFPFPGTCITLSVPTDVLLASNGAPTYERYD